MYKKTSESKAGDSPAIEGLHEALVLSGIASMPSVVSECARFDLTDIPRTLPRSGYYATTINYYERRL
jgi:hypothetical protein